MLTQICHAKYCLFLSRVKNTNSNSVTGKTLNGVIAISTRYFRHSLLNKIIESEENNKAKTSYSGKTMRLLSKPCSILKGIFADCSNSSVILESIKKIKDEIFFYPFTTAGIIMFTATITNIFLSIVLRREICILGWVMSLLLLCSGCAGMLQKLLFKK